jgi:hypothetical protein
MHRHRQAMDACAPLLRNATGTSTGIVHIRGALDLISGLLKHVGCFEPAARKHRRCIMHLIN